MRRSSRSVFANIAEVYPVTKYIRAFRKRRYPKSFISKLSDSEAESAEPSHDKYALPIHVKDYKETKGCV